MHARGGAAPAEAPLSPREMFGQMAGVFAVVLLAYLAGATLAWTSFGSALGPAFFYPSAGVTVAAMVLIRRSLWPAVIAAILPAEFMVDTYFGSLSWVAAGYGLANAVEPVLGAAAVLSWCGGRPDLRERRDLMAFMAGACALGPLAGGLVGGTVNSTAMSSGWLDSVALWWAGDALGVLVVAAPILLWTKQIDVLRKRSAETIGVLLLTGLFGFAAFRTAAPPSTLILPMLAWAALRLDMLGAALTGAVVAFVSSVMASRGYGPFAKVDVSLKNQLVLTQLFVAVLVAVSLLVAQEASARLKAVRERESERQERMRLEGISQLAHQLSAALEPEDIGRAVERHILNEVGAKSLNLGLLTPDGRRLEWVAMAGYPPEVHAQFGAGVALKDRLVATDAVRTGEPVLIHTPDEYARRYGEAVRFMQANEAKSAVGWPLAAGGKAFGVLLLMWQDPQPLDPAQLAYISAVATMVGQALVRARIYSDEHARATVLQSAVMPTTAVETAGVDVSVSYEAAESVRGLGGDWYDVMVLPKNQIYFAVGDVMGHGLHAVEDMAQLRSAGRALAHQGLPPEQLLSELNRFTRHASHSRFATMAVAVLEPDSGMLSYGTAGHPPPLLRRVETGEVVMLSDSDGPVLGPLAKASFTQASIRLHPGDVLVMYTDGLVERLGTDIDTGIAQAREMIAGWVPGTVLQENCDALQQALAPRPRNDDVCIIAARFGEQNSSQ